LIAFLSFVKHYKDYIIGVIGVLYKEKKTEKPYQINDTVEEKLNF
jgi:hypothetical protein